MSSTPIEKKNVNIKVTLKQKIEYLQRTYHRLGQTDNWKAMDKLINTYEENNFEKIDIIEVIGDVAARYEDLELFIGSLELYYEILKIKEKIESENMGSIINTWEKIMTLNSCIGNKEEARKIFLYTMSLRGYKIPRS